MKKIEDYKLIKLKRSNSSSQRLSARIIKFNSFYQSMISKELKKAVQELPSAEKDTLIFCLLRKDNDQEKRFHF